MADRGFFNIIDLFRRPERVPMRETDPERVKPGRESIDGWWANSGWLPNFQNNAALTLRERWRTFEENRRDCLIVGTCIQRIESFIGNTVFTLEAADDSDEAMRAKDLMEEVLFKNLSDCEFARIAIHIGSFQWNGFSLVEWERSRPDDMGRTELLGLHTVDPSTIEQFIADRHGQVFKFVQLDPNPEMFDDRYRVLSRQKFLYSVFRTDNNSPDGLGGLQMMAAEQARAWSQYFRKQALGYDLNFVGDPWIRFPAEMIAESLKKDGVTDPVELRNAVLARAQPLIEYATATKKYDLDGQRRVAVMESANQRSGGDTQTVSQNPLYDFGVLQGEHGPHADMREDRIEIAKSIARLFACDDLLFGDQSGNRSLGETKLSNFRTAISELNKVITETLNRDLVKPFAKLNGLADPMLYPKFSADIPKELSPLEQAQFLDLEAKTRALTPFNDTPTWNALRKDFNILPVDDDQLKEIDMANQLEREMQETEMENTASSTSLNDRQPLERPNNGNGNKN